MLSYLLFGGGLYMVLMAVVFLIQPKRNMIHYYFASMYSSSGLIVMYAWAERTGMIFHIPILYNIQIPLCFVFAPLLYYGFSQITDLDKEPARFHLPHFIPSFIALLTVLAVNIIDIVYFHVLKPGVTRELVHSSPHFFAAHILGLASNVYILYFLARNILAGMRCFKASGIEKDKELRLLILYVVVFFIDILIMTAGHLLRNIDVVHAAKFLSSLTFILYSFYSFRYPEYTQKVVHKLMRIRYRNSQVQGLNINALLGRLEYLMNVERIYTDMELTLAVLAGHLLVTPHQVSEILNDHLHKNFNSYINQFRIRDAKHLLKERPDVSVLQIAFDVGFNSKASFNANFQKLTGMTPSEFRKAQ